MDNDPVRQAPPAEPASARPARPELARFARFVLVSTLAAAMNFGSRIVFSQFVPYAVAIVLAFVVGLSTAFLLARAFVFSDSTNSLKRQGFFFVAVNFFALAQTLAFSLVFARSVLPALGVTAHAEAIAHAIGIGIPVISSYFGHKYLSFRTAA